MLQELEIKALNGKSKTNSVKKDKKDYSNEFTRSVGSDLIYDTLYEKHGDRYVEYRKNWKKASDGLLLDYPLNIVLDLMNSCNLNCPQCLRAEDYIEEYGEFLKRKGIFDLENIRVLMNESQKFNLPSVNIGGGGEPMLHPKFIDICKTVLDHDVMELRVVSNGTLFTKEIAESLVDIQLPILSISLDANSPEVYKKSRGKPEMFEVVVNNIEEFLKIRNDRKSIFPLLRVTFCAQPVNVHEKNDFLNRWSGKADMVDIQGHCSWSSEGATTDFHCPEPWQRIMFYAEGTVAPCCGFTGLEYEIGRLEEQKTIHDIWHGEKMNDIREMIITKEYKEPCLRCVGSLKNY